MNKNNTGCNITISTACLFALFFTWWTDRNIDFWCSYFSGHNVNIHWFWSFLLNLFGGIFVIIGDIVSEIVKQIM